MSKPSLSREEALLAEHRARRDSARAGLASRLEHLRGELRPEALAGRVIDDLTYRTQGVMAQAMEIASDNRGIVAGTVTALALWLARKPLGRKAQGLMGKARQAWADRRTRQKETS